jgi:hypothetical protein
MEVFLMTIYACPKCGLYFADDSKGMCAVCIKERRLRRFVAAFLITPVCVAVAVIAMGLPL